MSWLPLEGKLSRRVYGRAVTDEVSASCLARSRSKAAGFPPHPSRPSRGIGAIHLPLKGKAKDARAIPLKGKAKDVPPGEEKGGRKPGMNKMNNPKLKPFAQRLRREMTKEERHLWYNFLRGLPVTFNRQKVVGPYIVDFYCAKAGIVIELDGSQHFEQAGMQADRERDAYLSKCGLHVLRYSNEVVNKNFTGVCENILQQLGEALPSPYGGSEKPSP